MNHLKISIYINESDKWQHLPLYLELLNVLKENEVAGGTVLRAIAGFTYKGPIESTSMVDLGSKLPLVFQFIDTFEKVDFLLPKLKTMVGDRLVISEQVEII